MSRSILSAAVLWPLLAVACGWNSAEPSSMPPEPPSGAPGAADESGSKGLDELGQLGEDDMFVPTEIGLAPLFEVRAELVRRSDPLRFVTAFDGISTPTLYAVTVEHEKMVYGSDGRREIVAGTPPQQLVASRVVAMFSPGSFEVTADEEYALSDGGSFRARYRTCAEEPFGEQPVAAFCSGFLVGADLIATAAHCLCDLDRDDATSTVCNGKDAEFMDDHTVVFGYAMVDSRPARRFPEAAVFHMKRVVSSVLDSTTGEDWAIVQLDRPTGRQPLVARTQGKIADDAAVFVIGHPVGLPAKLADGATVRSNRKDAYFVANLDTYGGNSGSPVFNQLTMEVEGILVRGEKDFVEVGSCRRSLVCPDDQCRGEDVVRSGRLPWQSL